MLIVILCRLMGINDMKQANVKHIYLKGCFFYSLIFFEA